MNIKTLFELKRDKAAFRTMRKFIKGEEVNSVTLAKSVSSVLTHALIEVEGAGSLEDASQRYSAYHLEEISFMLMGLITGDIEVEVIRKVFKEWLDEAE